MSDLLLSEVFSSVHINLPEEPSNSENVASNSYLRQDEFEELRNLIVEMETEFQPVSKINNSDLDELSNILLSLEEEHININPPKTIIEPNDSQSNTPCEEPKDSVTNFPNSVANWNSQHIMKWILDLYDEANYQYEDLNLYLFQKRDGKDLISLTENDFQKIDRKRSKWLYEKVQEFLQPFYKSKESFNDKSLATQNAYNLDNKTTYNPPKRKRGRPPKTTKPREPQRRIGQIWEFLRDLLLDPQYCPSLIYWEDYNSKKFRLVNGTRVAKLWGQRRNKPHIDYKNFSRSIRHYYGHKDRKILSVPKENLVYRFGEAAKIETDNPNFGVPFHLLPKPSNRST